MRYEKPTLAVVNQKGGVGKSTVSCLIAESAAIRYGLKVLFIDLDMQANSSDYFVGMDRDQRAVGGQLPPVLEGITEEELKWIEPRSSIADIFFGKGVVPHITHISPENGYSGSIEVMVAHPAKLETINTEFKNLATKTAAEVIERLGIFIHRDDVSSNYDVIILDTGPSRNPIFRGALRAATHALIPFEPEEKSLQGINAMMQATMSENYSRSDHELRLIGLVPNKVRMQTNLHQTMLNGLYESIPQYMPPKDVYLPQSTAFPERDMKGITPRSIFEISSSHRARKAAAAVSDWVLNCMGFKLLENA